MLSVSLVCLFMSTPSVFPNVYLFCVLCTLCCQFLWLVYLWVPLRCSLTFICYVSCVPCVLPVSLACLIVSAPSVFSNVYLFCVLCTLCSQFLWLVYLWVPLRCSLTFICCVLCTLCCQFLWLVYLWVPLRYSLTFICSVSCVPCVASFSGLSICECPFGVL